MASSSSSNNSSGAPCAVVTFGCNDDGQLGRGEKRRMTAIDEVSAANFPLQVGALNGLDIVAVSCGSRHSMVLTTAGDVYSWGWGTVGLALSLLRLVPLDSSGY